MKKMAPAVAETDRSKLDGSRNGYRGYCLDRTTTDVDKIDCTATGELPSPSEFFHFYVKNRKPCIIKGGVASHPTFVYVWKQWRDLEYLKRKAGKAKVFVEKRSDSNDRFGKAREHGEQLMSFESFLAKLESPQEGPLYYLTTQHIELDTEDRPRILSEPLISLRDDFPIPMPLGGNLVLMNCNIWIGASIDGSTSGFHHDFHDNFYLLLKGKKRFQLISPDQALKLSTRGTIAEVFHNGLIRYEGEPIVTSCGVEEQSMKAWEADLRRKQCEQKVAEAEAALEKGEEGAEEKLRAAEDALEKALDDVLEAERDQDENGDGDQEDEEEGDFWASVKKRRLDDSLSADDKIGSSLLCDPYDEETEVATEKLHNFCEIEADLNLHAPRVTAEIEAGDMLYLPAGWFHEVTSYSTKLGEWHLALNYWFHPPDNLENFDQPYLSAFWASDWEERGTT